MTLLWAVRRRSTLHRIPPPPPPAGQFGAGAVGAAVPIPAGAIPANPGNLASLINSNGAFTDFALQPGTTFPGSYPNKTGNGYYGDPNDHTVVLFDGGLSYANNPPQTGEVPNGGEFNAFVGLDDNTFANFTMQKYKCRRGSTELRGAPIDLTSTNRVLIQNCESLDNHNQGFRLIGNFATARFCTGRFNGAYAFGGGGSDHLMENCILEKSGDDNLVARGVVARESGNTVGCCKFAHTTRLMIRNNHFRNEKGFSQGCHIDINNTEVTIENNLVENIGRIGIFVELGHSHTIQDNTLIDTGLSDEARHIAGAIFASNSGLTIIRRNVIDNTNLIANQGIGLWQRERDFPPPPASIPENSSAMCGTTVEDNIINGKFRESFISSHCTFTKDGCNFFVDQDEITIRNNTETGTTQPGFPFWINTPVSAATWAAAGYS